MCKHKEVGSHLIIPYNESIIVVCCSQEAERMGIDSSNDVSVMIVVPKGGSKWTRFNIVG